jgi:hypothetical protein
VVKSGAVMVYAMVKSGGLYSRLKQD